MAAAFALVVVWVLGSALIMRPTYDGDAGEYFLMTESLFRHLSPDLRYSDVQGLARLALKSDLSINFADIMRGYFEAKGGQRYSYHFWGYSLLALPGRALFPWFEVSPLKAHQTINALLLLFALWQILVSSRLGRLEKAGVFSLTLLSPALAFVLWPHPEAFSFSLVTVALLWSQEGRRNRSILAAALAALQNPPLVWLVFALWAQSLLPAEGQSRRSGRAYLEWKALGRSTLAALPALLPMSFFYLKFGTASVIAREGTTFGNLSPTKALELFLDLNIGMLPYLPLTLLVWAVVALIALARLRPSTVTRDLLLLSAMALSCTVTLNWNHGTCGPSRYAVWMLPFVFFGASSLRAHLGVLGPLGERACAVALIAAILSQAAIVLARGGMRARPDYLTHSYAARFVLRHVPRLYNPSREIFVARTTHRPYEPAPRELVVYAEGGSCRKALARPEDRERLLEICGAIPTSATAFFQGHARPADWRYVDY